MTNDLTRVYCMMCGYVASDDLSDVTFAPTRLPLHYGPGNVATARSGPIPDGFRTDYDGGRHTRRIGVDDD